ncbi:MAG: hypothetical protein JOZ29_11240 [Deltaproteobacteria bacterium]|nr:hypothetical protein [Deltaproteobacteria bacterium]
MLANYRPEYSHGWDNKIYYTQLRLNAVGEAGTDQMLDALLSVPRARFGLFLSCYVNLQRNITELLKRPAGKPSYRPLAKVEVHFGELFSRVGFIVTNLTASNQAVVRFYNKRGTAEQWIKEANRRRR